MGEAHYSLSLPSLICHENQACFNEDEHVCDDDDDDGGDDDVYLNYNYSRSICVSDDEDDYIEKLVSRESGFGPEPGKMDGPNTSHIWIESARLDAIDWIFNVDPKNPWFPASYSLSLSHLLRSIHLKAIHRSCLSLAAKMEEQRVPPLSEFLVKDYAFEDKLIQRMELLVLSTLNWKMGSITPFSYLHFFIRKFHGESSSIPKGFVSRAVELILDLAKEINNTDRYRASVLAAGAVLAASDCELTRTAMEIKMGSISSGRLLANEDVFSCYELMKEVEMGKNKTPKSMISGNLSSGHSNSDVVIEISCSKRRLTFDGSATLSPVKKIRSG